MSKPAAFEALRARLRGTVLTPADPEYDPARKVFNAMVDRRPALIARCASAIDVVRCVDFAGSNDLGVSVRGGGHGVAGKAVCDGGLMIDLSGMKEIAIDPVRRTARVAPGLRLGEFDRACQRSGLATPTGIVSDTGIAGLTLGGGIGWLNGKHGLACDSLLSVEIVTADGRLRTAGPTEHADLFWAVRGGGGNFGIVTAFEYRLHAVSPLLAGMVLYPLGRAKPVLRFYHEFAATSPDDLSTAAVILTGPDGQSVLAIAAAYAGPLDAGERVLKPLQSFDTPVAVTIAPMSYVDLQRMVDASFPAGRQHYWKSSFLQHLGDGAIETLLGFAATRPSPQTLIGLQQMHGAAARVSPTATGFAHRHDQYDFIILSMWSDPAETEANVRWTRDLHTAMQPMLERSVYVNNLGDEGTDRVRAAYGVNYDRLAAIKTRYDPANFFRSNQNIAPAS